MGVGQKAYKAGFRSSWAPSAGGPEPGQEPLRWFTTPAFLAGRRKYRLLLRASKDLELTEL